MSAVDSILVNVRASIEEATEHHRLWPPPGGQSVGTMLDGPEAETGSERCLWPRCFGRMRDRLDKPPASIRGKTLVQRERFLWHLYHFKEGGEYPNRWMFWRCPLETPATRGTSGNVLPGANEERDFTHYGDGIPTDSLEGIRRSKANAKEIARRLRSKPVSVAVREGRLRKERDQIERMLSREDSGLSDAERSEYAKRSDSIQRQIPKLNPPPRPWDWLNARPVEETPLDQVPF